MPRCANYVSYAARLQTGLDPAPACVPTSVYPLSRGGSRNSLGLVGQGQDVNYCPVGAREALLNFPTHRPTSAASRLLANFTLEVLTSSAWSLLWRV